MGLAKAFANETLDAPPADSPKQMASSTPGMILGTTAYMSPEQANGTAVDRRSDIFAFGAVLYEMLTGQQAFPGETAGAILAAVIRAEPDWRKLPAHTPAGIRRLLRRCLQKDRNRRLQTALDARIEIDEAANQPQMDDEAVASEVSSGSRPGWAAWIALALAVLITLGLVVWNWRVGPAVSPTTQALLELNTPQTTEPVSLAISLTGRRSFTWRVPKSNRCGFVRSIPVWYSLWPGPPAPRIPSGRPTAAPSASLRRANSNGSTLPAVLSKRWLAPLPDGEAPGAPTARSFFPLALAAPSSVCRPRAVTRWRSHNWSCCSTGRTGFPSFFPMEGTSFTTRKAARKAFTSVTLMVRRGDYGWTHRIHSEGRYGSHRERSSLFVTERCSGRTSTQIVSN